MDSFLFFCAFLLNNMRANSFSMNYPFKKLLRYSSNSNLTQLYGHDSSRLLRLLE